MEERLQHYLAKQDIYELICTYARGLDRLNIDLLHKVFWPDGWCEYGFINCPPAEFAEYCIAALKDHAANQHLMGNTLIDINGNEAFGEVYFQAYHKIPADEGFDDVIIAGRYLDRYENRDGVWKMAYRSEVVDWSRTAPTNDPYFDLVPGGLTGERLTDAVFKTGNRYRPDSN